jgi:hypothetical protein
MSESILFNAGFVHHDLLLYTRNHVAHGWFGLEIEAKRYRNTASSTHT